MKCIAHVVTMFKPEIPDPHSRAILNAIKGANYDGILNVRTGKEFRIELDVATEEQAREVVDQMCQQLLAHKVTDDYQFTLELPPPSPPNLDDIINEVEANLAKINAPRLHALLVICETKDITDFDCVFLASLLTRYQKTGEFDEWLKAETNPDVLDRWQKVIGKIFGRANKSIFKNPEGGQASYMVQKMIEER